MTELIYTTNFDSLAPLIAALLNPPVTMKRSKDGKILLKTSGKTFTSINAIVCKLMNSDPLCPVLCEFLLWESTALKPIIKDYTSTGSLNQDNVIQILKHLELKLSDSELFHSTKLNPAMIVLCADLYPLFSSRNPTKFNDCDSLKQLCTKAYSMEEFQQALKTLTNNSDSKIETELWSFLNTDRGKSSKSESKSTKVTKSSDKNSVKAITNNIVTTPTTTVSNSVGNDLKSLVESGEESLIKITDQDLIEAEQAFAIDAKLEKPIYPLPKKPLPKSSSVRNILVTSALPYVNNVPHLGNLIGSTLSASTFASYCDLAGHNVLSICGTDEYGTATETKAFMEKMTPQQICDKYHKLHCDIYRWFQIEFDYFGRTSTEKHKEIVQDMFNRLWSRGFIKEDSVEQLFCENCSKFLADRFVEGICPLCKFNDARGDQCDRCGHVINATDIIQPRCKMCQNAPIIRSSNHLFLDLPKIENKLSEFIENRTSDPKFLWTSNACTISKSWIRDGLKERCITRDLQWGVPVPLENYTNKVFYVWFDAPLGYLSITANYTPHWEDWWKPNSSSSASSIELFQFMAKDNVPFHAIIFPACLLAADSGHTLIKSLLSTEYMNYESTKFSKSRGIGVFGDNAMNSGISSDVWRFYLLYRRPESQDSAFSWDDFMLVNNSELLNNFGNFINRALLFVVKFFDSIVPATDKLEPVDKTLLARINKLFRNYVEYMEACHLRDAIRTLLSISSLGNGYIQSNQPWISVKNPETRERACVVIGIAANIACFLGLLVAPFMPTISVEIWVKQCNMKLNQRTLLSMIGDRFRLHKLLPKGYTIGKPAPLFRKIEPDEIAQLSKLYSGQPESVSTKNGQ